MKVSVIIPCYNVADYIIDCLDSVYAQTYSNLEVIVIDNNSTDATVLKIKDYVENGFNALTLAFEKKQGAPAARNKGLGLASGEWIQFLDADDILLPNKIKRQVELIENDVPFIVGKPKWRQTDGTDLTFELKKDPWKGLFEDRLGYTGSNLWNRSFLNRVGGWEESLSSTQDYFLMFELLKHSTNLRFTIEEDTIHRDRPNGQITTMNQVDNWHNRNTLRLAVLSHLQHKKPLYFSENKDYFYQCFYIFLRGLANHDLTLADQLYTTMLCKHNIPNASLKELQVPLWNSLLVKKIGFYRTEKLKRTIKKLLGKYE